MKWVEGVIEVRRKPTADTLQVPPGFVRAPCFYSQVPIRYREWTHSLFGSKRPATDPDITASAVERQHRTPKLAFSVLDYINMTRDGETVTHESHKLEVQVRFLVPQPYFGVVSMVARRSPKPKVAVRVRAPKPSW